MEYSDKQSEHDYQAKQTSFALEGKEIALEEKRLAMKVKAASLGLKYKGDGGSKGEVSAGVKHIIYLKAVPCGGL